MFDFFSKTIKIHYITLKIRVLNFSRTQFINVNCYRLLQGKLSENEENLENRMFLNTPLALMNEAENSYCGILFISVHKVE